MKWKLILNNGADRSALVCEDLGDFQLDRPLNTPKRYYLKDEIVLNGVQVELDCHLEDILRYGAIKLFTHGVLNNRLDERLISDPITVTYAEDWSREALNGAQTANFPDEISWRELQARLPMVQVWLADPRLLFLALFGTIHYYKADLWKQLCLPVPTHEAARAALRRYDALVAFSIYKPPATQALYPLLQKIWLDALCEHYREWNELVTAIQQATPAVPTAEIKVAGVFAIKHREYILGALERKLDRYPYYQVPATLSREPHNQFDSNAISVKVCLDGEKYRIGYLPKEWAAQWAATMDQNYHLNGAITAVNAEKNKVLLNLSCRKGTMELDRLVVKWGRLPSTWHEATLSITDRTLVYSKNGAFNFTLHFADNAWQDLVIPTLTQCAISEWKPVYRSPEIDSLHDEAVWHVELTKGTTRFCSCGCRIYPVEWLHLRNFIEKCLDLTNPKGSGTFTFNDE